MKIGFIGLGIMGSRMAANLQKHGHELIVHNRSKEKASDLIANGAVWANTPADVAPDVDVLITMLAHPEAVKAMALGENGFVSAMSGKIWVDCSTVNPSFAREMAEVAQAHNVKFLDAPVAGSKNQAEAAQLVFIVGGDADSLQVVQPLMEQMGSRVVHIGEAGMGTSLKVVVNMLLATSMAAFAEGLVLGEQLGIPRETLMNVIVGGPVGAPYLAGKRPKIESADYSPEFPLRWMQKDLQMVTQAAYEVGVAMPVANTVKDLFQFAVRGGFGDQDISAIYAFLNQSEDTD